MLISGMLILLAAIGIFTVTSRLDVIAQEAVAGERRRAKRYDVSFPARLMKGWFSARGHIVDISRAGVLMQCWTGLPLSGSVRLAIPLGEDLAVVPGRIVRWEFRGGGMMAYGIEFDVDSSHESNDLMESFFSSLEELRRSGGAAELVQHPQVPNESDREDGAAPPS